MIDRKGIQKQTMCENYCRCDICTEPQHISMQQQLGNKKEVGQNCMQKFLEMLPRNFPLMISPTAIVKTKQYYFNKFGNRINSLPFNKITEHFPLALHLILYYQAQSTITYKYDLNKQNQTFLYVQGYSTQVPILTKYDREDQSFMDEVLSEKLMQIVKQMLKDDYFNTNEQNRDFLKWAHSQYKDELFCKYMSKIIFTFIEQMTSDKIVSASLEWVIEKNNSLKLNNVYDLKIEKKIVIKSFQQEYQEKILQKLNKESAIQVQLFNSYVRQPKIGTRVKNFKKQIRQFYEKEKIKIIQKTEKERNIQSKTLSDEIARLFLPDLHKYSSLREVLNDEEKFKKVVLGANRDRDRKKNLSPISRSSIKSKVHTRSKTEV